MMTRRSKAGVVEAISQPVVQKTQYIIVQLLLVCCGIHKELRTRQFSYVYTYLC